MARQAGDVRFELTLNPKRERDRILLDHLRAAQIEGQSMNALLRDIVWAYFEGPPEPSSGDLVPIFEQLADVLARALRQPVIPAGQVQSSSGLDMSGSRPTLRRNGRGTRPSEPDFDPEVSRKALVASVRGYGMESTDDSFD